MTGQSAQEVFDAVVARLRDGTGQATDAEGCCCYRTDAGLKCAVGIFIPDGHPAQESQLRPAGLADKYSDIKRGVIGQHRSLLTRLQFAHDAEENWSGTDFSRRGENQLRTIAHDFGLDCPEHVATTA